MADPKKLPNGRWQIRYRDPQGRPRSKVCDTKAEARDYVQDVGHAGRTKAWVAPELGRITLRKWAEQYMSTVVHLRPTTVWLYERELKHILARFGSRQLNQLRPLDIQAWLAELLAGGMAPSSVHRKYRLLRRLLQVAMDKGVIARSPCAGVQPPRVETDEPRFLTPGEVVALAESIDPWFRALVFTAVETGMRWSELVGLRRSGVDLLRRSISVTEQLVYIGGDSAAGRAGRWVRQKPKTRAGVRSISISAFLAEQLEEQLTNRSQPGRDGLVFVNMRGGPVGGSIFNKRHWQPARGAVGLDRLRFHDYADVRVMPTFPRTACSSRVDALKLSA
jgi:integrase